VDEWVFPQVYSMACVATHTPGTTKTVSRPIDTALTVLETHLRKQRHVNRNRIVSSRTTGRDDGTCVAIDQGFVATGSGGLDGPEAINYRDWSGFDGANPFCCVTGALL
jgi:hypothetical protein